MKKYVGLCCKILGIFLVLVLLINIVIPGITKKPDEAYAKQLAQTTFEKETGTENTDAERIRCIDDNDDALVWRLRMMESAKKSVVLSTFDLRPDDSGKDIIAALYHAASKGVKVKILIDGIYQKLFLEKSKEFQALTANENVEVRIYNPITLTNLTRLNYRMHDKYLIIDDSMYLLGGRNTNDIFLGDKKTGINVDRDILVYETEAGKGSSYLQLKSYFHQIWNEKHVAKKKVNASKSYAETEQKLEERYCRLQKKYADLDTYQNWEQDTYQAEKISLIDNGTGASRKSPNVLQAIEYIAENAEKVVIQTPYVISNAYMYQVLSNISDHADLKIILNAVEKGSNPWGCTDYLNQKKKILDTDATIYELMNEHAVHTKAVLVDDHISIVGSYNLDMRSTYLDTELMLVIDSKKLNQEIRATEDIYMKKSKEVKKDGTETVGELYKKKTLTSEKKRFYAVLRVIIRPFRHLL